MPKLKAECDNDTEQLKSSQYSIWVTGWTTGVRFPAGTVKGFFLFFTASRPALGPT